MDAEQLVSRLRTWAGEDRNKVRAADMAAAADKIECLIDEIEQLTTERAALTDFICWYVPDDTAVIESPEGPDRYDIRAEALDSWLENRWEQWCNLHGDDDESDAKFSQTFETYLSAAFARGEILPEDGA